jgi:peptidoglycan/LPS O-acetylase OafA/YrhL
LTAHYGLGWIVYSFTALASVSFVYVAMFSSRKWLQVVMTNRFLIYTGTISYGLYLLHKIPSGMVETLHLDRHPFVPLPFIFVMSFVLATLSWNLLEKPFLNLKRFFESKTGGRVSPEVPVPVARG